MDWGVGRKEVVGEGRWVCWDGHGVLVLYFADSR